MKLTILAILAAISLCAQSTTILTGRVTDSVTSLPIEQASITLEQGSYHDLLFTDASGNFIFDEVPLGTVTVKIRKGNYVLFERTNPDEGTLDVTADARSHNFRLTPASSIRGKARSNDKFPGGISIRLLKEDFSAGFSQYAVIGPFNAGTDGSYEFTGLDAGKYLIGAGPGTFGAMEFICVRASLAVASVCAAQTDGDETTDPTETYAETWYPGTTNFDAATPITLGPGEKRTADFEVAEGTLFRVSGEISGAEIESMGAVILSRNEGKLSEMAAVAVPHDRAFSFAGIAPGQYVITVNAARNATEKLKATLAIAVTDHDIEGIKLAPQSELQTQGRFRMANSDLPLPANQSVEFGPPLPAEAATIPAAPDGKFTLKSFSGEYSVQPTVPAGYAVTEIRYAGGNPLNQLIRIDGGSDLAIVLSNQPATISGSAPVNATVVLAPSPLPEKFDLRSLRVTATDKDGNFSFQGLPAGQYKTAVLTGDDRQHFRDLTILNGKFSAADTVEITAGQKLTIVLKP